jgi:uncharacterized protein YndB with AHSA1/START domain
MSKLELPASSASLQMRKVIRASPERVFHAWTNPDELTKWWGPKGVRCVSAEIELIVGGQYRIENELPDGTILWIGGEFDTIEKPHFLSYTWIVETEDPTVEHVSVRFEPHESGTEVILSHAQIRTAALRDQHQHGWLGCMDGLLDYLSESGAIDVPAQN